MLEQRLCHWTSAEIFEGLRFFLLLHFLLVERILCTSRWFLRESHFDQDRLFGQMITNQLLVFKICFDGIAFLHGEVGFCYSIHLVFERILWKEFFYLRCLIGSQERIMTGSLFEKVQNVKNLKNTKIDRAKLVGFFDNVRFIIYLKSYLSCQQWVVSNSW